VAAPVHRRYTPTAQALHWLMTLLIVVQFALANLAAHRRADRGGVS
jgi:cytochrome b561